MESYDFSIKAPAKINYVLEIKKKRDDGYHDLLTVFQAISLYDRLFFKDFSKEISFSTNALDLGSIEQNLVYKAANLLKKKCHVNKGAQIFLEKNIPHGSGLGGGSSDAAATLKGLNRLWNLKLSKRELFSLSSEIGSDVAFFIEGAIALGKGRGDKIVSISHSYRPNLILGLVCPNFSISTPWAYKKWDDGNYVSRGMGIDDFMRALYGKNPESISHCLYNDFEMVVNKDYPQINLIISTLKELGAIGALMSGSGSSVFGIFMSHQEAIEALKKVKKEGLGKVFIVNTI